MKKGFFQEFHTLCFLHRCFAAKSKSISLASVLLRCKPKLFSVSNFRYRLSHICVCNLLDLNISFLQHFLKMSTNTFPRRSFTLSFYFQLETGKYIDGSVLLSVQKTTTWSRKYVWKNLTLGILCALQHFWTFI